MPFYLENRTQALWWEGEVQERGDMCMPMASACWCVAETNTIL